MTLYFPDLNVWLALSINKHKHSEEAWKWLRRLPQGAELIFSRYTHLGLLRLLTNQSAMGEHKLTLKGAWSLYDAWLAESRVEFHPEPRGVGFLLRELTEPFADKPASNLVGDCYLLACARASQATLVTFDKALYNLAHKRDYAAVVPSIEL